jgi:hypothetical protein
VDRTAHDTVFWEVQRIIRTNGNFRGKPGRFNRTLFDWFTASAASGIRRQLKDKQSISLMRFLGIVREHPGLVSREHYVRMFGTPLSRETRATANREFDRYSGRRGPSKAHIRRALVSGHIRALGGPSFCRIEEWVDRHVAHMDSQGMRLSAPRLRELSSCLRTLDRILCRYHLLLQGYGQTTVRATIQDDWTDIFTFAWEPRDLETD